jgi:hypothetical protein
MISKSGNRFAMPTLFERTRAAISFAKNSNLMLQIGGSEQLAEKI